MAETSVTSNNPFRRKSAMLSAAAVSPAVDTPPSSAEPGLPLSPRTEAAGISGSSTAAFFFEQHLQSLQQHPTGNEFRDQLRALPKSSEAPPSTTFLNPKPVKKVRVQSPPSSPDSVDADFETRFPAFGAADTATASGDSGTGRYAVHFANTPSYDEYSSGSDDTDDDASASQRGRDIAAAVPTIRPVLPHNPFQKTQGDMQSTTNKDEDGETATAPAVGKGSIDVDAFRRLLMTGQADGSGSGTTGAAGAAVSAVSAPHPDSGSLTTVDTAHMPQDSPRSSHEISEMEDDRSRLVQAVQTSPSQRQILRKKPPPPSSRHGKLINSTQKEKEAADEGIAAAAPPYRKTSSGSISIVRPSSSSSDVNKPLPAPSFPRNTDENGESIFDHEAAGKTPEVDIDSATPDDAIPHPRLPTPPNASHSIALSPSHPASDSPVEVLASSPPATLPAPAQTKKPAPPPRRQMAHGRSDSRSSVQERVPSAQPLQSWPEGTRDRSPGASRRSSVESTRSRSSSMRIAINAPINTPINAPAPPPPRRPHPAARPSMPFTSPTILLFPSMSSAASSPSTAPDADRSPNSWNSAGPVTLFSENTTSGAELAHRDVATVSTVSTVSGVAGSAISGGGAAVKLAKPPPPPTRSISVRKKEGRAGPPGDLSSGSSGRPPSTPGADALSHRVQTHSHQQPPPPPPRARGSSRGSTDSPLNPASGTGTAAAPASPAQSRKVSYDNALRLGDDRALKDSDSISSSANTILADLNALQREVDALRGQFSK